MLSNNINSWAHSTVPNYPILFVTRWIPFNAWYVSISGTTNDRDSIQMLKTKPNNLLYDRIKHLVKSNKDDFDCQSFQHELNELEKLLQNKDWPSTADPLCFGIVEMGENSKSEDYHAQAGYSYRVTRYGKDNAMNKPNKSIDVVVDKLTPPTSTITITLPKHDNTELESKMKEKGLTVAQKAIIRRLFKNIEPIKLVDVKSTKNGKIKIGKSSFCNDEDAICAQIVDVLYGLRCKAVHGEIEYSQIIMPIYEHAFIMLNLITKKFY